MALFVEQYELSKGLFEPKVAGSRVASGKRQVVAQFFEREWRQASLPAFFAPAIAIASTRLLTMR